VDLETGFKRPFSSPEHIGQTELAASCHHDPPSSRAVGLSLEESPASYRLIGLAIPPCGSSTSWFSGAGREPYDRFVSPSPDSVPASECFPVGRDTVLQCLPLSRGLFPLQRNPTVTSHRSRSCLLRVLFRPCRSCRLRRLAPVAISLVVSTRRARGVLPSELDTTRIASASRRSLPSCDWRCGVTLPNGPAIRRFPSPRPPLASFAFRLQCIAGLSPRDRWIPGRFGSSTARW